jgi:SNF2 family DNA or RNA helicase
MDVKLRDDPGQKGVLTGRERERADGKIFHVRWQDGTAGWKPEYELIFITDDDEADDVFALLRQKQFGRLNDLRRNLTFIQLSGRLANVVYSMDTTNTDFYAYQYKPVLTFLESPSNGILIADEVGLGKTIEAGLIWTELRARYDARRLVVLCPAMLREKWCDELSMRFGVEGVKLNAEELLGELKKDKHLTPDGKGFVCSIQGLRPPRRWQDPVETKSGAAKLARFLEELSAQEPAIDLLIIDEAHYLRNPETQSAALGRLLREVTDGIVLLSATPVNNKERDLFQLLKLVDPDTFSVEEVFPQVLSANEPLVKARNLALNSKASAKDIKDALAQAVDHPLLSENKQLKGLIGREFDNDYLTERANRVDLANRIERINLLRHTITRTRKVEVQELKVVRDAFSQFVELNSDGPEWDFYVRVTEAIRAYAFEREINDGFLLVTPQKQISSCMYAAAKSWKDRSGVEDIGNIIYENFSVDREKFAECTPLIQHIASQVLPFINVEDLKKFDSKYGEFSKVVTNHLKNFPGEKLIVFSYFKGTLRYLAERLFEQGITTQLLHGSIGETKQDVIDRFRSDAKLKVLLTSEVASEGVDLQFCRVLINYDIPWNPMRIEQRIGRIDRIGQEAERITIWNLCYANTIDERIFSRLLIKLNIYVGSKKN